MESIQYNAALAITEIIRGTSSEKLCQELGLESRQQRHWHRKLCTILKTIKEKSPDFLFNIIAKNNSNHRTRNSYNIPQFNIKHNFFKNSFFPSIIAEWNKLDSDILNLNSLSLLESRILVSLIVIILKQSNIFQGLARSESSLWTQIYVQFSRKIKSYLCLRIRYWNTLSLPHLLH